MKSFLLLIGSAGALADNPVHVGLALLVTGWLVAASIFATRILARRRAQASPPTEGKDGGKARDPLPAEPSVPKSKGPPLPVERHGASKPIPESSGAEAEASRPAGVVLFRDFSDVKPRAAGQVDFPDRDLLIPKRRPVRPGHEDRPASPIGLVEQEAKQANVVPESEEAPEMITDPSGDPSLGNESQAEELLPKTEEPPESAPPETLAGAQPAVTENTRVKSAGPIGIGRVEPVEVHDRNYNRFRSSFELFVREHVHSDLRALRCVQIGITGEPVLSTYPSVLWREPESFFSEDLHERADALFAELHHHAVRCAAFQPTTSVRDREVAIALFHHSLWRGQTDRLAALIFRLEERGHLFAELRELAILALRIAGEPALAQAIDIGGAPRSAFLGACTLFLDYSSPDEASINRLVRQSASVRETRLVAWLRAARVGDRVLESRAIRGLAEESVSLNERVELLSALLSRGKLYRATRLLYRLQRARHSYGRPILELYFRNGKYHCYLRALQAVGPARGPRTYYETAFCLALSRLEVEREDVIAEFQRQGLIPELPSAAERMRFERAVEAVDHGRYRPAGIPQRFSELVGLLYFYAQQAQALQTPDRQKSYVRALVRAFRNNLKAPSDLSKHELVLPYLIWGALYTGRTAVEPALIPFLQSLAGRSQAVRVLLGAVHEERGEVEAALDYLSTAPQHPFVLHRVAHLKQLSGDLDAAVRVAGRLVKLYPGEAVFRHNHGVLLELSGRRYEAEQAYGRAVDLQSDLGVSQDRLSRLLAHRTGGG